jgi:hypothetical protein
MATKKEKKNIEVLLVSANIEGIKLQPKLKTTTRLITVDLIWPRSSIARKTAARELKFSKAQASVKNEKWTQRILFREDIDDHCGIAVSISEILDDEWIEKLARATAKYALREFRDIIKQYTVGISDIASAPLDALSQLEGTYPGPKTVLQGTFDLSQDLIPEEGYSKLIEVPLHKPRSTKKCAAIVLEIRN